MMGVVGSAGRSFSPWHAPQSRRLVLDCIRPSGGRAGEERGHNNATQHEKGIRGTNAALIWRGGHASRSNKRGRPKTPIERGAAERGATRSYGDREGDDVVAALESICAVAARTDDDILFAVDHVGRRGRIDAGYARLELAIRN